MVVVGNPILAKWEDDVMRNPGVLRICVDKATVTTVGAILVTLTGCGATPTVEVDRDEPIACIIDMESGEPYGLRRVVQTDEEQADRIRLAYTWTNDCSVGITLYDINIQVWHDPDRAGDTVGDAYIEDVNIGPNVDAEVEGVVRLREGYRGADIEGTDNVEMNFNIRYTE